MKAKPETYFKEGSKLQHFFDSDHINLQNSRAYFREKGIFVFANKNDLLASFAQNFILGIASQEALRKYIDVNARSKISGFIILAKDDIPLSDLQDYLDSHCGNPFAFKKSTLLSITNDDRHIYGKIEYYIAESTSFDIFNTERKEATFEISKDECIFTLKITIDRDSDYSVIREVISSILSRDSLIELKIVDLNLANFLTSKRHEIIKELISSIESQYKPIGIIRYYRSKSNDLGTTDVFEQIHKNGVHDTDLITAQELTSNLEDRGAVTTGINLVIYDKIQRHLFVIGFVSNDKKRRIELSFVRDFKQIDNHEDIPKIKTRDDIDKFDSAIIGDDEKEQILVNIWNLVSKKYFYYWEEYMKSANRL